MEIAFASKALRTLCEDDADACRRLGQTVAASLRHRLADLRAAENLAELVVGAPRPLDGVDAGSVAIDLAQGACVIVRPNRHGPRSIDPIRWADITRLQVLEIRYP